MTVIVVHHPRVATINIMTINIKCNYAIHWCKQYSKQLLSLLQSSIITTLASYLLVF